MLAHGHQVAHDTHHSTGQSGAECAKRADTDDVHQPLGGGLSGLQQLPVMSAVRARLGMLQIAGDHRQQRTGIRAPALAADINFRRAARAVALQETVEGRQEVRAAGNGCEIRDW